LQWTDIADGLTAVTDASPDEDMAWKFGDVGDELIGRAIIGGYDSETDTWIDATLTIDEAREVIKWADDDGGDAEGDDKPGEVVRT
jgi:hypothetical protein